MLVKTLDVRDGPFLLQGQSIGQALRVFEVVPYSTLPVTDDQRYYKGVVNVRDILLNGVEADRNTSIDPLVSALKPLAETDHVEQRIAPGHHDIVPFVSEENILLGFVTKEQILQRTSRYYRELAEQDRKLLESSYNGIMAIDKDGKLFLFNPAAERMLGRRQTEVIGKHISFLDPSMGLLDLLENPVSVSGVHVKINGHSILSNRSPLMYEGQCVGAMSVFQDISDLESTCAELSVSKSLIKELDAIFESSYDGFYIANHEGRVTRVNSAWEKFCGFSRTEVIGKTAYELVKMGCYDKSAAVAALEQKKTVTFLCNIMEGPRKGNQVMATGTPIFDGAGNLTQVVVNVRDMSDLEELRQQLASTVELNRRYASELEQIRLQNLSIGGIVAKSTAMQRVLEMAARIATVDSTVLIMGESGVGKEVIANNIHSISRRKDQAFIKINCGAIPENLLESELFGYAGGAFTGAKKEGKPGMFELASGGTLFLDEIGELPLSLQVKLLRMLQEKTLVRVGGTKPISVDVRVMAATNRDLPEMVRQGTFRDDLYYRLNVFGIQIPPLRQRREDLPPLLHSILGRFNEKYGMEKRFSPAAAECLLNYDWPGNVREVENLVERVVVLSNTPIIEVMHLPEMLQPGGKVAKNFADAVSLNRVVTYKQALEELERRLLEKALAEHGSTRKVAKALDINQSTVVRKIQQYKIPKDDAPTHQSDAASWAGISI